MPYPAAPLLAAPAGPSLAAAAAAGVPRGRWVLCSITPLLVLPSAVGAELQQLQERMIEELGELQAAGLQAVAAAGTGAEPAGEGVEEGSE